MPSTTSLYRLGIDIKVLGTAFCGKDISQMLYHCADFRLVNKVQVCLISHEVNRQQIMGFLAKPYSDDNVGYKYPLYAYNSNHPIYGPTHLGGSAQLPYNLNTAVLTDTEKAALNYPTFFPLEVFSPHFTRTDSNIV